MITKTLPRLLFFLLIVSLAACSGAPQTALPTAVQVMQASRNAPATQAAGIMPATQAAILPSASAPLTALSAEACLNNTHDEAECKDCCDALDTHAAGRKACRDACPQHDFSQNQDFITVQVASLLGPGGDYSACTAAGSQGACKECCDSSTALQSGDRRYCRDACNQLPDTGQPGQKPPESGTVQGEPGDGKDGKPTGRGNPGGGAAYNIEQAISDKAQGMTIAFDALAFLTGSLGADSFFPPGKVADFWGFQYLRDNDTSQMGHAGDFLTSAAMNVLYILTPEQRAELVGLAESQVASINAYGYKRFVLMDAFRRMLNGDLPAGTTGLDESAVKAYSAELYRLDGEISFARAQMMGKLINAMDAAQLAYLDSMVGKGMLVWPQVEEPADIRGLDRDVKVAVMTYAADMFSWYAGSVAADVYFCPERHGTYFGAFYLKDMPAMSDPSYVIPTDLTGNMGEAMLQTLTGEQAQLVTDLVEIQKPFLSGIVDTRQQVSTELRKFLAGGSADQATVLGLMEYYGELDGEIVYNLAMNFARVNQTLTSEQKAQLMALRQEMLGDLMYPSGAYLYSQAIPMPEIPNTDFLFK
ncbi:MAG: hypothetical protein AB1894_13470 [Chloroflexota bacterium]